MKITANTLAAGFFALILYSTPASAKYIVDGGIDASVCTSYVIFSTCRMVRVDAVKGDDGSLFTLAEEFKSVTEYTNGRCFIRLKYSSDWLSWVARRTFGPIFFTKKPDGEYAEIDAEYITFRCLEQN